MNKRTFLGVLFSFLGFEALYPLSKVQVFFNTMRFLPLSDHVLKTGVCIAEHIYPADKDPGAVLLGMDSYIAHQSMSSYFHRYIPALKRMQRVLDSAANEKGPLNFLSMNESERSSIINHVAAGDFDGRFPGLREDFYLLVEMTLEGCFSDPSAGGNRSKRAWQLLGGTFKEEWFNA